MFSAENTVRARRASSGSPRIITRPKITPSLLKIPPCSQTLNTGGCKSCPSGRNSHNGTSQTKSIATRQPSPHFATNGRDGCVNELVLISALGVFLLQELRNGSCSSQPLSKPSWKPLEPYLPAKRRRHYRRTSRYLPQFGLKSFQSAGHYLSYLSQALFVLISINPEGASLTVHPRWP